MKVSLVATVKDAGAHVGEFLASLAAQTRAPDEVVIVDGGSTDGTLAALKATEGVTVLTETGANIARGRNVAIAAATHDVIAVTDPDCVLAPDWLERLLEPIERGADVSMGLYRPLAGTLFEASAAAVAVKLPEEVRAERFMPSARSVAFRRDVLEAAGGYPEWLDIGEDMWVNQRWRELGVRMELAPDAIVRWRPRSSLLAHAGQYFRYAEGDALAGMHPERHAIRFAVYGGLAAALASRSRPLLALAAAAGAAYAWRPARRAVEVAGSSPARKATAAAITPAVMAVTDLAKMAGYLTGLARRARRR